jgi:hypothetical protein
MPEASFRAFDVVPSQFARVSISGTPAGVEFMHMIRKGQLLPIGEMCPAHQVYSLTR